MSAKKRKERRDIENMGIMETVTNWALSPLVPHKATPELKLLLPQKAPTIMLSLDAYRDTTYIIKASGNDEVGWLGSVQELEENQYLISRVFLLRQDVSMGHCEFDQNDMIEFFRELLAKSPANKALVTSIRFWGHLHPGDMSTPSVQDDNQMRLLSNDNYFIRGIFTRTGKAVFTFFDYRNHVEINDCQWAFQITDNPEREAEIKNEIKEKVRKLPIGHMGVQKNTGYIWQEYPHVFRRKD